eukprot:m.4833 g.4833  ORF g.4833 m.4833 type:complete len:52 (+) comp3477_c0_seq1:60-215(+)
MTQISNEHADEGYPTRTSHTRAATRVNYICKEHVLVDLILSVQSWQVKGGR